jgi:hypothetical protein
MTESGYYPPGAEFDPRAPWNEPDIPEKGFDVCISQTLSKSTKVITDDYYPEEGCDEDGPYMTANTSNTDWRAAYDNDHYTPLQLIGLFKEFLEKHLPDPITDIKGYEEAKSLIAECENWTEDETEVVED